MPDLPTPYALAETVSGSHCADRDGRRSATLAKSISCRYSTGSGFFDELENLARDEAFEAADEFALGFALRRASRNVVDCACATGGHPHEHDAVIVKLAVRSPPRESRCR